MAILPDVKRYIYDQEIKTRAAISEGTFSKIGSMVNFIGHRVYEKKQFFLNGRYRIFGSQNGIDGLDFFEFDAEIFNVFMFNSVAGSSGTTELDLKIATASGGSFTSIFSTTPKIQSSAGNYAWTSVGSSPSGTTAPVLAAGALTIAAGTAIRLDCLQVQGGNPENCGLVIHYRAR